MEPEYKKLIKLFPGSISTDVPIAEYTTFKIGGKADLFCSVFSADDLFELLKAAWKLNVPYALIGGGSNLLVDDKGYRGLVIRFTSERSPIINGTSVTANAGNTLASILDSAAGCSVSGFEFLAGIPGTVGGALFMNAGAFGNSISGLVTSAEILTPELERKTVTKDYFKFSYRSSILQNSGDIVLSVSLEGESGIKEDITKEYNRIKNIRAEKHPGKDNPCAGSYFKNLPPENPGENRQPSGKLLEQAGAKSMSFGGASVFRKHANMIVNSGNASADDVLKLAEKMKKAVYDKFGITLKEEVKFFDSKRGIILDPETKE